MCAPTGPPHAHSLLRVQRLLRAASSAAAGTRTPTRTAQHMLQRVLAAASRFERRCGRGRSRAARAARCAVMLSAAAERRAAQPRIRPPSPGTVDVDTDTSPSCVALSLLYKGTPRNFVRPADEALAKTLARVGRNVAKAALAALPKKERAHAKAPRVVARLLDADGRDVDSTLLNSAAWGIAAQLCLLDADDEAEAHYYDVRVDRPDVESVCVLHEALPGVRLAAAAAGLRGCAPDEIRWCWRRRHCRCCR